MSDSSPTRRRPARPPGAAAHPGPGAPAAPASKGDGADDWGQITRLAALPFVDLYVPIDQGDGPPVAARFNPRKRRAGQPKNADVPPQLEGDIARLRTELAALRLDDSSLDFDGMRLRVSRETLANGARWSALRRVSTRVPTMEELRFRRELIPHLRHLGERTGLILICGATGQGKTTTANAMLGYFLEKYGEVAVTIEDPVEFDLQGGRGHDGYCFQVEVEDDAGWAPALKKALRWHPRYLLVGEIRSGEAAAQVLRAATSGHLVITTFHAGSVERGLYGLIQVAEQAIGRLALQLISDGLACILHQTLTPAGPSLRYLFTDGNNPGDPIRACIRDNKMHLLRTHIERQENLIANASSLS